VQTVSTHSGTFTPELLIAATRIQRSQDYHRRYEEEHRTAKRLYHQIRRQQHKTEYDAYYHTYYEAHKTEILAKGKEYRQTHRDELRVGHHQYYLSHLDALKAYDKQLSLERPEIHRLASSRRRALIVEAEGTFTLEEFTKLCTTFSFCCVYCGQPKPLGPDHVIPLARGGSNSIDNIVPACRSCNSSKGVKTFSEYIAYLETLSLEVL
jgi:5-methylcytosine-specific restriction endonuclease McrA